MEIVMYNVLTILSNEISFLPRNDIWLWCNIVLMRTLQTEREKNDAYN